MVEYVCITFSPASGPGGSGRQDGGACLAAPWGTGLIAVVVGDSSGSAGQPRASCRLGAWAGCWAAFRVADQAALGRGCPLAIRQCRCRRHSRRRLTAQGR